MTQAILLETRGYPICIFNLIQILIRDIQYQDMLVRSQAEGAFAYLGDLAETGLERPGASSICPR